ncbi:MAG: cytochrome c biogenesis protein ResB [Jatrophihabitans sp.]
MTPLITALRKAWRRLTSMRTALILLFLLAVAAVPGSLLPQTPLNPGKAKTYIAEHGVWGRLLDAVGAFDVFGSVWFAAIYLLLFVSLVGCLIPRIRVHARAVARKPLPAPRNLARLPESGWYGTTDDPVTYAASARSVLGRRWRVTQRSEESGAITLSAEKGYSRETGNLIFHMALLAALLLVAVGRLYSYEGSVIVRQGQGVCNTITQYDQWKPGRLAAQGAVRPAPFCIDQLSRFTAKFTAKGEPRQFVAKIDYTRTAADDAKVEKATITVNHPLRLEGDRVYLINHGFAPQVTIRKPDGTTIHQSANFLPTDGTTLYSEGVFSAPGPDGAKKDVGIRGYFAPTAARGANGLTVSSSPDTKDPVLGVQVFLGDLNQNGQPRSVYTIDVSKMKRVGLADLRKGQSKTFPNGVTVTFDGWLPWVGLQVSHDPTQSWLLLAALAMVVGLAFSLGVRRRRLWLRIAASAGVVGGAGEDSPTVVTVGGLARSDSGNFTSEFSTLLARLQASANTEPSGSSASPERLGDTVGAITAGKD